MPMNRAAAGLSRTRARPHPARQDGTPAGAAESGRRSGSNGGLATSGGGPALVKRQADGHSAFHNFETPVEAPMTVRATASSASAAASAAAGASAEEWQARMELAACYRLAAHFRMTDLIYTHITARVPGEPGRFLINPYGFRWEEITASSLVKIDVDGNKAAPSPHRVNPAGFTIHSAVHMSRHDATFVMHTHTRAGVAVSALEVGLMPLNQIALQFHGRVGYHDFEGIALDLGERERIIADLGDKRALILRNHGLLTVGRNAAEAFSLMYYLNAACEIQVSTLSMGMPVVLPAEEVCRRVAAQYDRMSFEDEDLALEWSAHLRLIDGIDPSYRA
jgi:ribulose-5-phosphate 4-epimerase/fuculose-1-phosphate aldolase